MLKCPFLLFGKETHLAGTGTLISPVSLSMTDLEHQRTATNDGRNLCLRESRPPFPPAEERANLVCKMKYSRYVLVG
jgi:hypothetical protein